MRQVLQNRARLRRFQMHLPHGVPVEIVKHLPTQPARSRRPQMVEPLRSQRPLLLVHRVARSTAQRFAVGCIVFQCSNACQYSPVSLIWRSSISPTSRDTEVFSSAAFAARPESRLLGARNQCACGAGTNEGGGG